MMVLDECARSNDVGRLSYFAFFIVLLPPSVEVDYSYSNFHLNLSASDEGHGMPLIQRVGEGVNKAPSPASPHNCLSWMDEQAVAGVATPQRYVGESY